MPHDAGSGPDPLAGRLSDVARTLNNADDLDGTLEAIVHAAAQTVPGAEQASISSNLGRSDVRTRASSGALSRATDRAQYETGQGPCLDAVYLQRTVHLPDMQAEHRWPEFASRARTLGVGSMLVVQLFAHGDDMGALNLLSTQVGAFGADSEQVALLLASHAAVAMSGAQRREQLEHGLDTRDLIGQAKGILMERYGLTGDAAFAVLVRYSQRSNRKLRHVAEDLVAGGNLPGLDRQE